MLGSLIEQAKNPKGYVGKTMLKIINSAHTEKMAWGLSKLNIADNAVILDIGCGGGKTIGMLSAKSQHSKIYGIDYSKEAVFTSSKENYKDDFHLLLSYRYYKRLFGYCHPSIIKKKPDNKCYIRFPQVYDVMYSR